MIDVVIIVAMATVRLRGSIFSQFGTR